MSTLPLLSVLVTMVATVVKSIALGRLLCCLLLLCLLLLQPLLSFALPYAIVWTLFATTKAAALLSVIGVAAPSSAAALESISQMLLIHLMAVASLFVALVVCLSATHLATIQPH